MDEFSGGFAFWRRRGREWAEEQPVDGRTAFATWLVSALIGWLGTMLLAWAFSAGV